MNDIFEINGMDRADQHFGPLAPPIKPQRTVCYGAIQRTRYSVQTLRVWLNFVYESTVQLFLWYSQMQESTWLKIEYCLVIQ
jgi:hypothetical protein